MEWLTYLLKVSVCMGLFYLVYHLLLKKLTFFSLNRWYLLSTLLLSFAVPLLEIQVRISQAADKEPVAVVQPEVRMSLVEGMTTISGSEPQITHHTVQPSFIDQLSWESFVTFLYWAIAMVIFITMLWQAAQLISHSRKVSDSFGRLKVVYKSSGFTNCSFLHYVFVDRSLAEDAMAAVVNHESIHATRYHSIDKILLNVCKILLWFSPPIYFYAKALEEVHEYEADKETSILMGNAVYANLLLTMAVSNRREPLVHSFVKNPIKARISMLFTNQSKNMNKLTYLSLIPAGMALVWLFSVKEVYAQGGTLSKAQVITIKGDSKNAPLLISAALSDTKPQAAKPSATAPVQVTDKEPPLRLVDYAVLGEDPLVIIDGKKYTAEILTRISPACVKSSRFSRDKAEITTKDGRIEFATKADIATAKIRLKMKANGKFYNRYKVTMGGKTYDEILIRTDASSLQVNYPKDYRVMLCIEGKVYTEEEAKNLPGITAFNITGLKCRYADDDPEVKAKYGDKCDVLFDISRIKVAPDKEIVVTRNQASSFGEDAVGRFFYSAKDSTIVNHNQGVLTLYGEAKIQNSKVDLTAEKISLDKPSRIALAENVSYKVNGKTGKAPYARFDLYKGTFEILGDIPGISPE
ncbi:M56 family metallopeptidase [Pedobacter psychroterrae]|uniref:Peptidase M56 domain-containing protein n=1 Tax=Pedobacter psychroterrae TaxID=2530453 RepID=A0A4R0NV73_9SPHI|nr:M56 family metallopeptidase [Pedobacter psychroterrae]TCD03435.1 hypothetical protein EZ437_05555 [Pedobacter psychroterrae]